MNMNEMPILVINLAPRPREEAAFSGSSRGRDGDPPWCRGATVTTPGFRVASSAVRDFKGRDVARLLAELDADEVDGYAGPAVLVGIAPLDQLA